MRGRLTDTDRELLGLPGRAHAGLHPGRQAHAGLQPGRSRSRAHQALPAGQAHQAGLPGQAHQDEYAELLFHDHRELARIDRITRAYAEDHGRALREAELEAFGYCSAEIGGEGDAPW